MDRRRWGWVLGLGLGVAIAPGIRVHAQIVPDGSLGSEGSVTTPMETGVQIDGGALRGDNLFHSFQEFSVPTNSEAFFNNPDVANIFSRVTGGSISDIDGLLRANGTANLFLLNPNGIVFGPNARLDIGGSFVASTANSLVFENGLEFSASDAGDTAPLLSVNVPLGVQFNGNPGSLEATGATLNVSEGGAIALVGGEISLDDVEMNAPAGRIDLVGVGEAGPVRFEVGEADSGFPSGGFGVPADLNRASVSLDGTTLNVTGLVGGEIGIQALDVEMRDSLLQGGIAEGLGIEGGQSGNIDLDAIGNISISDSRLNNEVEEGSIGNAGDINLLANTVEMTNGARLTLSTMGRGNAGSVTINANESIVISGSNSDEFPSGINVSVREGGQGDVGQVNLSGEFIEISDGAFILSGSLGEGNTGNVTLEARETVSLLTEGRISTAVLETGQGNVGNISVIGSQVEVRDGAQLSSMTSGQGNAGRIDIYGADRIVFSGEDSEGFASAAFSSVTETGQGNAGDINLISRVIQTSDGAFLSSRTSGEGDSGNVTIEGHESVLLSGGFVLSGSSGETQTGNAGNVRITGERIELRDEVYLSSSTSGDGNSGTITVESSGHILFSNSSASSASFGEDSSGNAGNISVIGETVELRDRASLSSSTQGQGDAGNISVIGETIELRDEANLSSDTFGQGNAGNINVIGETVELWDGASLSSSTLSDGDGGTITVEASGHVLFSDSSVSSSSLRENTSGNAGNISVIGETVELRDGASLSSDTRDQGDAGNVVIIGETVELRDEARLSSSTLGVGDAGRVIVEASGHVLFSDSSALSSSFGENYSGNAGNIRIIGETVELRDGAILLSSTRGDGNAGRVIVEASGHVLFSDSSASSGSFGEDSSGNAGNIRVTGETVELRDGASLFSSTFGQGEGGIITVEAGDTIVVSNASISSGVAESGTGNAGGISIRANTVELFNEARLSSSTSGEGDAGRVVVEASGHVLFSESSASSSSFGEVDSGNAGNVSITGETLELRDGSRLSSTTSGDGDAGRVIVEASGHVLFSDSSVSSSSLGEDYSGNAGNIRVMGETVELRDGASLFSTTWGQGDAGSVTIEASDMARLSNSNVLVNVEESGQGNGGDIRIISDRLFMEDGARLNSSTSGQGNAGTVTIEASGEVIFSNSFAVSAVGENARGNAGGVSISANTLEVQDGAVLNSATFGQGNAGTVTINANDRVVFSGVSSEGVPSSGFTSVWQTGQGDAGDVSISANTVEVRDGATLDSSTFGQGNAGTVTVQARDTVIFSNGSASSAVEENAQGNAGGVRIFSNSLEVRGSAWLTSSTLGQGNAGTVTIEANDRVILSGLNNPEEFATGAFSAVGENARGNAGGVSILANSLEIRDGAQLNSSTLGQGNAGSVTVEANDRVVLSGVAPEGKPSAGLTSVGETGQGNAGGLSIVANSLELRDGAVLDSSTFGQGNAGTVSIEVSDTLLLSDGFIMSGVAETGRGNAGNVTVVADRLEVHDGLFISSSLNQGDAGTITIEVHDTAIFSGFYTDLSGPEPEVWPSGVYSTIEETGQGNAGGVNLIAGTVELRDGTRLSSSNNTTSNANDFT
ncbi:MAG: filamentous hemagglutinin N-terminal domain-containing protein, partial [Phormidium sp. BM_Day4_Bin.17]|nr:filamentous hemagglutinin N-terminal domain-containing protein [Phormidium sp. BM_Day4_Bin.17]